MRRGRRLRPAGLGIAALIPNLFRAGANPNRRGLNVNGLMPLHNAANAPPKFPSEAIKTLVEVEVDVRRPEEETALQGASGAPLGSKASTEANLGFWCVAPRKKGRGGTPKKLPPARKRGAPTRDALNGGLIGLGVCARNFELGLGAGSMLAAGKAEGLSELLPLAGLMGLVDRRLDLKNNF